MDIKNKNNKNINKYTIPMDIGSASAMIVAAILMVISLFKGVYNSSAMAIFMAIFTSTNLSNYFKTKNKLSLAVGVVTAIGLVASLISYIKFAN